MHFDLVSKLGHGLSKKSVIPIVSNIGYRTSIGGISDITFHEEMMAGVDDTPLRLMSAYRCMALGMTREEVEDVFKLKLPPDSPPI
jgi:hypothetical protein